MAPGVNVSGPGTRFGNTVDTSGGADCGRIHHVRNSPRNHKRLPTSTGGASSPTRCSATRLYVGVAFVPAAFPVPVPHDPGPGIEFSFSFRGGSSNSGGSTVMRPGTSLTRTGASVKTIGCAELVPPRGESTTTGGAPETARQTNSSSARPVAASNVRTTPTVPVHARLIA